MRVQRFINGLKQALEDGYTENQVVHQTVTELEKLGYVITKDPQFNTALVPTINEHKQLKKNHDRLVKRVEELEGVCDAIVKCMKDGGNLRLSDLFKI